ncbi:MAG: ribosome maturation factor RimP [Pseudomonadota bacterium]
MIQVQDKVRRLVEGPLKDMGYELVRVSLSGGSRPVLQIMAEREDGTVMTVDDCSDISHTVSLLLDADDPIAGAYALEVSSPGIDRPLTRPKDFERYAGFEVRMETRLPIDGRRRFRGRLRGFKDGIVALATDKGDAEVPFEDVIKAQLVLTDELIAASTPDRRGN